MRKYRGTKDTCWKSYLLMRPLSDPKSCEQHLLAHSRWRFLSSQIELFCKRPGPPKIGHGIQLYLPIAVGRFLQK